MAKEGRNTGGRAYGYRLTSVKGQLEIDHGDETRVGEADIVRRIYRERLSGMTPRAIAGRLNAEGIPSPTGGRWNASTINGSKSRRNGILRNPIYQGTQEWNRVRMVRNPSTGKRVSRINNQEEIASFQSPELAIIDADTFQRVQAMFPQNENDHPSKYRRSKTIFSGLLKCGCCGGGMSMKDNNKGRIRMQCSVMKESRSCKNTSAFYLDDIAEAALGGLHDQLNKPTLMKQLIKSYNNERSQLAGDTIEKVKILDRKIEALTAREEKLWADYDADIIDGKIANERILKIKAEIEALRQQKCDLPSMPDAVAIHPSSVTRFKEYIEQLSKTYAVQISEENREAATAIRRL